MTPDDITEQINAGIKKQFNSIDDHDNDHEFITLLKTERHNRRMMWQKRKANVIGWLIIGILGSIGTATYHYYTGQ